MATDSDPGVLLDAPLLDVAAIAERQSNEDWRNLTRREPFQGLVQKHTRRALAVLILECAATSIIRHCGATCCRLGRAGSVTDSWAHAQVVCSGRRTRF